MSPPAGRASVGAVGSFEQLLARWCDAEARADAAALDVLLGADFHGDVLDGRVLGKEQWLDRDLSTRAFAWHCLEVRVGQQTAVATGIQCRSGGAFPCTLVAVRRGGRWAIVNVQLGDRIDQLADVLGAASYEAARIETTTDKEQLMTQVVADMSMSLDGFIADANDGINDLVPWMFSGDVEVPTAAPGISFRTSQDSASVLRDALANVGALISGRRNFDLAQGWGGTHPMGVPVFVVTHNVPDGWPADGDGMRFVTDGVESAVAQAKAVAGDKTVGVATPSMTQQCLDAGLLDAIHINVVPVLLGKGVPFFANIGSAPVALEGPEVVEGDGVTHLTYRVRR